MKSQLDVINREHKNKNVFAKRFAYLRISSGLMQKDIAKKLGVSIQAVSKWECGRGTPKFEHIPLLASLFDVSIDYLFGYEKNH